MKRNLPPLNALKFFEQAARSNGFKEAADTLMVTKSAVSKQIKRLENYLGVSLFERNTRGAVLTDAGRAYFETIAKAIDIIEFSTESQNVDHESQVLLCQTTPSFGEQWLSPKLHLFRENHPHVLPQIVNQAPLSSKPVTAADVTICCYPKTLALSRKSEQLFEENLVLIACRSLIERKPIQDPSDLSQYDLYIKEKRIDVLNRFLKQQNYDLSKQLSYYEYQHFYMVLNAVRSGLGIGVVPEYLCLSELQSGDLVRVLNLEFTSDYGYFVEIPRHKRGCQKALTFLHWVKQLASKQTLQVATSAS